jgi:hypothetical protein
MSPIPSPNGEIPPPKRPISRYSSAPEPLIDSEEAAAIIGIHPKTLQKWRVEDRFAVSMSASFGASVLPRLKSGSLVN